MKRVYLYLFAGIIILSLILRFWHLGAIPSGFDADEAAYGYNAYSIIKTGADEYGKVFPIALKSFGEYKPALYAYLTIPAVLAFDLTPFATRFASALFGTATVVVFFFFTYRLTKSKRIALVAAFILAISPWHLNLSRTTSEVVVSLFFILSQCYAMLSLLETKRNHFKLVGIAIVCGLLAILSYTAATFFVVLLTILFTLFSLKRQNKKVSFNKPLALLLLILIVGGGLFSKIGSINRFNQINIFQHPETKLIMEEQIREDQFTKPFITRAFHNKIINTVRTGIHNYGEYFSLDFLALNGGFPFRERVDATGLFYLWEIPLLIIGVILIMQRSPKIGGLLVSWWLLLLVPAAITFDEIPNVYRTLVVLPAIVILIAYGSDWLLGYKTILAKVIMVFVGVIGMWEFAYYEHQYFMHQDVHQPWYRGYAYKELTKTVRDLYPSHKEFVITKALSSPYIYFLFYDRYDPKKYQQLGSPRDLKFSGFDKYRFSEIDCPLNPGSPLVETVDPKHEIVYINKGVCPIPLEGATVIKRVNWEDGNPALLLLSRTSQELRFPPKKD